MFVDIEQKHTGLASDEISNTILFWQEFEIGENNIIYFSSLIDITKDFLFLLTNWKTKILKNAFPLVGAFSFFFMLVKSEAGVSNIDITSHMEYASIILRLSLSWRKANMVEF